MVSPQTVFTYPFFIIQSYKSYYMVSPQTVFTYPFHHAKLQILLHGVTTNSLYLNPFHHAKLQILLHGVTANSLYLNPFHQAKLQILLHGVTANSLYLSFSPCKATRLINIVHEILQTEWACNKQVYMFIPRQIHKKVNQEKPLAHWVASRFLKNQQCGKSCLDPQGIGHGCLLSLNV